ncbi:MAG TPA: Gfo/Idh/MocA family oxidoreductase [Chloroflexota bacterium]|nr:Gfo/Idh/MocA family oxidoreductase [Chloroflexota bacterium]
MEKIRLGIIGCGGIARGRHLTGLTQLKRAGLDTFEVTALCDTVEQNVALAAEYLREEQGATPERYSSWEDLVARGPVDAVDICLPHGLHHVVGIAALEAGLHVVVEKPYTVTVNTGRELAEAADRTGKVLAVAVPHRRMPGQRAVHWALNEARLIGEPRMFFTTYTQWRPPPGSGGGAQRGAQRGGQGRTNWRRDRMMGGGAGVIDSGFHFLDSIRYFYGQPQQVYAELRAFGAEGPVLRGEDLLRERENSAVVMFSFQNGVTGTWAWSFQTPGKETRNSVIYGSEGSIEDTGYADRFSVYHLYMHIGELRQGDGTILSLGEVQGRMRREIGPERTQQLFPNGVTDHFATELWDFLEAIREERQPEVNGWGGLETTALVESIYESAYAGRSVQVAEVLNGQLCGYQRDLDEYWAERAAPPLQRTAR